jgi:hypothetical protein
MAVDGSEMYLSKPAEGFLRTKQLGEEDKAGIYTRCVKTRDITDPRDC